MRTSTARRVALLAVLSWSSGCGTEAGPRHSGAPADLSAPTVLGASEPVVGFSGPGGAPFEVASRTPGGPSAVHRAIGRVTFELSMRPRPMAHHPCTSCHVGPAVAAGSPEDAHQDVQVVHPAKAAGECATCHVPGAADRLVLLGGETTALDHAYRLCSQCHYGAVEAWAGGAHGKRMDGWDGRRVVLNCADCHDPHRPALERRIPFPGPILP